MSRVVLAACFAAATLCAGAAHACFDAFVANAGNVKLVGNKGHDGAELSYPEARELLRWAVRIDALLATDTSWRFDVSATLRCQPTPEDCLELDAGDWGEAGRAEPRGLARLLEGTFHRVARQERRSTAVIARARAKPSTLFAVQVGSFRGRAAADRLARSVNDLQRRDELPWEHHTAYTAGGFPAIHDVAFVADARVRQGPVYRVVVALFTSSREAVAHQRRVARSGHAAAITAERLR